MDAHRALALLLSPVTIGWIAVLTLGLSEGNLLSIFISLAFIVVIPIADVIRRYLKGEIDILVPERSVRGKFLAQASLSYLIGFILLRLTIVKRFHSSPSRTFSLA
ncbi:MAG: hypothetical protein RMI85_04425 [Candidatus Korarchaeum sp.]|nr:hypothetical protein [Candidatus Korarchaeum sp.]